jgi:hypothetical protein
MYAEASGRAVLVTESDRRLVGIFTGRDAVYRPCGGEECGRDNIGRGDDTKSGHNAAGQYSD